jgi:hypothetical protein
MFRKIAIVSCFLLALLSNQAYAWWEAGHMLVANIAYQHLTLKSKKELKRLIQFMAVESTQRRNYDYDSKYPNYTLMYLALWPDDLGTFPNYLKTTKKWHYIEDAYSIDGTKFPEVIPRENVVWAINEMRNHLSQRYGNNYDKARSLSYLIHFVGDIHQPMHASELFSKQFPKGDRGGNEFHLHYKEPNGDVISNLHSLWDSGLALFPSKGYSHNVYSQSAIEDLTRIITSDYPEQYFGDHSKDLDPEHWEVESHQLAIQAHELLVDKTPSKDYIDKNSMIAEQQIALAGYRLAHLLNQILG